jgi:hypothetical protein
MRAGLLLASLGLFLAACEAPAPRVDTAGQAARTDMDAATKVYAECIAGQAETMPVAGEAAGTLALNALALCKGSREALAEKVADFNAIGYPERTPEQLAAVAEASVKLLEDEARQAAVVTIIRRQNEAAPTPES